MNKVLFIYTHSSTFVRGDISILRKRYNIREYQFKNNPKSQLPLSLFKLFVYLLFNIYKYKIIYIWFADYHSFLPILFAKFFGKRVLLVIGGYDVCREKKYHYGSFSKPLRAYMALRSIKWATCNLCVSKNIGRTVKAIAPNAKTATIYNGVLVLGQESNLTVPKSEISETAAKRIDLITNNTPQRDVLCVALVSTVQAFYIKGINRYNRVAALLPNVQFTLVGCSASIFAKAGERPSSNLTIVEAIPHEQLQGYYRSSHVYCQFSRRESFSLSLAEAMSSGMIPVISTAGGMPEVTGGLGFSIYFYEKNLKPNVVTSRVEQGVATNSEQEAAQLVEKALKMEKSEIFRERVIQNFTLEKRETTILNKLKF